MPGDDLNQGMAWFHSGKASFQSLWCIRVLTFVLTNIVCKKTLKGERQKNKPKKVAQNT